MGDKSAIEWTDATWNVVTGCTKVSPGCANCYIDRTPPFRMAHRQFDKSGKIPLLMHEDRLQRPVNWTRPRRIFVNSLSDLFHEDLSFEFIAQVYAVMATASWHQYQILTKREQRALEFYRWLKEDPTRLPIDGAVDWPLKQVWFGMTAENAHWIEKRGRALMEIDAHVRWLSIEPLLDDAADALWDVLHDADGLIHWVVVGFESGPKRRPMLITNEHREWVRRMRDVCAEFRVEFLFKQWGGLSAKSGGRTLDGRTHDGYPVALEAR